MVIFINIIYFDYMTEESVSKLIHSLKWYQLLLVIAPYFFIDFCMLHNGCILLFSFLFSCFFIAFCMVTFSQYVLFLENNIAYQFHLWVIWFEDAIKFLVAIFLLYFYVLLVSKKLFLTHMKGVESFTLHSNNVSTF